jgi:hypothetical protein
LLELGWGFYFAPKADADSEQDIFLAVCTIPSLGGKEIVLSEKALALPPRIVYDTIRHEMAHALAFEMYGEGIEPHGIEWRKMCAFVKCCQRPTYKARKKTCGVES